MGRAIGLAWLVGIGLLVWREGQAAGWNRPVPPGRLGAASGLYLLLGLVAEYQPAAGVAALTAWGFDLALLLKPGMLPGTATPGQRAAANAPGQPGQLEPTPSGGQPPTLTGG